MTKLDRLWLEMDEEAEMVLEELRRFVEGVFEVDAEG